MLGYSVIEPKVCQKGSVGKRKEPKNIILEVSCLYDYLEATGWQVFVMRERANQQSGQ